MFGRRSKIDRTLRERGVPPEVEHADEVTSEATTGPFDIKDAPDDLDGYLDFGALKIRITSDFEVRLEMTQGGELNGISLLRPGSIMQLGIFAAPRSGGAWDAIREDILGEIRKTGGSVSEAEGRFGPEIIATLKNPAGDQPARFIGVDGPRWFLRALIAGPVAHDEQQVEPFYEALSRTVVERGAEPKPVREPITLRLPQALADQVEQAAASARQQAIKQQGAP